MIIRITEASCDIYRTLEDKGYEITGFRVLL